MASTWKPGSFRRDVGVKVDPAIAGKLVAKVQTDPATYRSARRLMLQDAQVIVDEAKKIAEAELHRRSSSRRTNESLAHGAEYHDSFKYNARGSDVRSLHVRVGNTHPIATIIEKGSGEHPIYAKSNLKIGMTFPWDNATIFGKTSGVNSKSQAWIDWTDVDSVSMHVFTVEHPGTNAHRILRRAAERYRDRTARSRHLSRH